MKRSVQVALLLMGATGVGAGAAALTAPRANCLPGTSPGIQGTPVVQPCSPGGSSSGYRYSYYGHWTRSIFGSSTPTSASPSGSVPLVGRSGGASAPGGAISGTSRGGFGSIGRGMSSAS